MEDLRHKPNRPLEKFLVEVDLDTASPQDLFDFGMSLVNNDGIITRFFGNKQFASRIPGTRLYKNNQEKIDRDLKEVAEKARKNNAFGYFGYDFGSFSMDFEMFYAVFEYWQEKKGKYGRTYERIDKIFKEIDKEEPDEEEIKKLRLEKQENRDVDPDLMSRWYLCCRNYDS